MPRGEQDLLFDFLGSLHGLLQLFGKDPALRLRILHQLRRHLCRPRGQDRADWWINAPKQGANAFGSSQISDEVSSAAQQAVVLSLASPF